MKTDQTLEQVTPLLGMAYKEWKAQEKLKNAYKVAFFALADEAVHAEGLALRLVEIEAESQDEARERVERHNPGWQIDEVRAHRVQGGIWEAVLREDPALKPYAFEHEGVKYARQVSRGPTLLDDDWLGKADPALYCEVTYELPWGGVIMLPLEHLDSEVLGRLRKYLYADKPRVTLAPPRPVKDEE